jgi:LysR family transcriptional regulator, glycine cleavage system transcriptional activator
MNKIHDSTAMHKLPPLNAVRTFEAAARLGSFALAAGELGVTPSAVSHQVRLLEDQLGVTLFHRVRRTIALTDAGRHYAEEIGGAFARIAAATKGIGEAVKGGVLTVQSTPSFATQWLMPRLSRFQAQHPNIDVRLHALVTAIDLAAEGVDVDIRYGARVPPAGAVMLPFPEETIVPLCTPGLANGLSSIRRPEDLRNHTLIHSEVCLVSWRDWLRRKPKLHLDLDRGPRFDRSFMSISAAVDGLGVCLESLLFVQRELAAGKLIMPLGMDGLTVQGHAMMILKSKAELPKIVAFRQWVFAELAEMGVRQA